jgi:hypothetical protein
MEDTEIDWQPECYSVTRHGNGDFLAPLGKKSTEGPAIAASCQQEFPAWMGGRPDPPFHLRQRLLFPLGSRRKPVLIVRKIIVSTCRMQQ